MTGITFQFDWEITLMEFLQSHMGQIGIALASFFTMFGEDLVIVGILAFLYWSYDKNIAKRLCLNLLLAVTWGPMIKNLVFRRRPYFDNPSIKCLKAVEADADIYDIDAQGFSFPSGHSFCSGVAYPGLAYYIRKTWMIILGVALPVLVAVSRFCLGVHYPTDVLAGLALGLLLTFISPKIYDKFVDKWWFMVLLMLLGAPGLFYCKTTDYYSGFGLLLGCTMGFIFEHELVNFEKTRKPLWMILRVAVGLGIFLGIAQGAKLFLPANYFTRVLRYAVASFVVIGPYTMLFKKVENRSNNSSDNNVNKEVAKEA